MGISRSCTTAQALRGLPLSKEQSLRLMYPARVTRRSGSAGGPWITAAQHETASPSCVAPDGRVPDENEHQKSQIRTWDNPTSLIDTSFPLALHPDSWEWKAGFHRAQTLRNAHLTPSGLRSASRTRGFGQRARVSGIRGLCGLRAGAPSFFSPWAG